MLNCCNPSLDDDHPVKVQETNKPIYKYSFKERNNILVRPEHSQVNGALSDVDLLSQYANLKK